MNKSFLFLIISFGILLIILIGTTQGNLIKGQISEIKYHRSGVVLKIEGEEYLIFEKRILDLSEGDSIEIKFKEETYKGKDQKLIEKIIKYN